MLQQEKQVKQWFQAKLPLFKENTSNVHTLKKQQKTLVYKKRVLGYSTISI